ncbi:hypothetical protein [Metabacillus endolithicus]|uniref:DUF3800 domain-containing protein n=1 Tax=Metabacillus endolithicus TaxID=1535204 RepID=A0ABW5C2K1_9BACI|nr:hypothetical protein [Metabacillus endolithicus]UPG61647.1 hypothetical protein MVE64_13110 [Metabacillus endolithicus]
MEFQLFLDESGDFENDNNKPENWRPSLIGGLLIEKDTISQDVAKVLVKRTTGKDKVHCKDETGTTVINILKELEKFKHEVIIFENTEKIVVIDSTTTYLNIIAEGLIQLITRLSAIHGKVELEVSVASRKDVSKGTGIIDFSNYEKILREKIIVGIAKKELSSKVLPKFKVHLSDARYDEMLMLSDTICNGFLTQDAKVKFSHDERQYLKKYFKNARITSLIPKLENQLQSMLINNKVSDAIFTLLLEYSQDNKETEALFVELLVPKLQNMRLEEIDNQLLKVTLEIGHLVKIQKEFSLAKKIGIAVRDFLTPIMRKAKVKFSNIFVLDVILYLYTIYTHEGDIEAEHLDEVFNLELRKVQDLITKLNYYIMYQNRKSVHLLNFLQNEAAINVLTSLIKACNDLMYLLEMIDDENLQSIDKFNQLGKLYGTRGQAYTKLINKNPSLLDKALKDFEYAIDHFEKEKDIERQYVYSANAFIQVNQVRDALTYLLKCEGISQLSQEALEECCDRWAEDYKGNIFKISTYVKIISMSDDELYGGEFLLKTLNKSKLDLAQLYKDLKKDILYPLPLIFWNLAKYYRKVNNTKLVKENIVKALQLLNGISETAYILKVLATAIKGWDYLYYVEENKPFLDKERDFQQHIATLKNQLMKNKQLSLLETLNLYNMCKNPVQKEDIQHLIEIAELI